MSALHDDEFDDLLQEMSEVQEKESEEKKKNKFLKIDKAKLYSIQDFWCSECQKDFRAVGEKRQDGDVGVYHARCKNNHVCLRYITYKERDAFWRESHKLKIEFRRYQKDLLQPHEFGYWEAYGKDQQKAVEKKLENKERKTYVKKY